MQTLVEQCKLSMKLPFIIGEILIVVKFAYYLSHSVFHTYFLAGTSASVRVELFGINCYKIGENAKRARPENNLDKNSGNTQCM